jgi:hypothetical protein
MKKVAFRVVILVDDDILIRELQGWIKEKVESIGGHYSEGHSKYPGPFWPAKVTHIRKGGK